MRFRFMRVAVLVDELFGVHGLSVVGRQVVERHRAADLAGSQDLVEERFSMERGNVTPIMTRSRKKDPTRIAKPAIGKIDLRGFEVARVGGDLDASMRYSKMFGQLYDLFK